MYQPCNTGSCDPSRCTDNGCLADIEDATNMGATGSAPASHSGYEINAAKSRITVYRFGARGGVNI